LDNSQRAVGRGRPRIKSSSLDDRKTPPFRPRQASDRRNILLLAIGCYLTSRQPAKRNWSKSCHNRPRLVASGSQKAFFKIPNLGGAEQKKKKKKKKKKKNTQKKKKTHNNSRGIKSGRWFPPRRNTCRLWEKGASRGASNSQWSANFLGQTKGAVQGQDRSTWQAGIESVAEQSAASSEAQILSWIAGGKTRARGKKQAEKEKRELAAPESAGARRTDNKECFYGGGGGCRGDSAEGKRRRIPHGPNQFMDRWSPKNNSRKQHRSRKKARSSGEKNTRDIKHKGGREKRKTAVSGSQTKTGKRETLWG